MADYFKNNFKFALKLFLAECVEKPNQNILISPLSLQVCLASIFYSSLSSAGANEASEHSMELLKLMQLSIKTSAVELKQIFATIAQHPESDFFNLNLFNRFYIGNDKHLNDKFISETLKTDFKTEVTSIDFSKLQHIVELINNECSKETESKISQIVNENDFTAKVDEDGSVLAIVNAATLKASWDVSFYDSSSKKEKFHLNSNDKIDIDMMENTIPFFKYGEFDEYNCRIAELQYAGHYENELSMLVMLPNEIDGINDLQHKLEDMDFHEICNNMNQRPMWIKFPKFRISSKLDVLKVLQKLAEPVNVLQMPINFSSIITNDANVKINTLIHKSAIESNEIGTDDKELPRHLAVCSELPDLVEFHVNRPFIFVIKDKHSIYFVGKVANI